jgi:hypothetical protein
MAKNGSWVKSKEGWTHTDPRMQEIIFQIQAGREYKDIAAQYDINVSRVSQIRHRAGPLRSLRAILVRTIGIRRAIVPATIGTLAGGFAGCVILGAPFGVPTGVIGFFAALAWTRTRIHTHPI